MTATLGAMIAAALAALVAIWKAYSVGRSSGRNEAEKGRADAYEKHLEEIGSANVARNRVGMHDDESDDKYRRD